MIETGHILTSGLLLAAEAPAGASTVGDGPAWVALIPALPLIGSILCCLTIAAKLRSKAPAWLTLLLLLGSTGVALAGWNLWQGSGKHTQIIHVSDWIHVASGAVLGGKPVPFIADFSFYMDGLSWLWMLFVTALASLICLYASEYMASDVGKGYGRFFAAFALFVFSMSCLVMGDNLILLYLGWEGVGLCSYLLIGYFYKKPAVAAAKKAFIVNRIGDLGLALGIFLIYVTFGTVEYRHLFEMVAQGVDANGNHLASMWQGWAIPCLLMVGAFGKSAQGPLYVWLPDAMEGPTPVSALIHAATMVTAGVYLVCRFLPVFLLDPNHTALTIVAWVGALTALWSATIGMAQFDIKRIMAYSTVSQLGYMFAGVAVLTPTGGASHVFTHAFFKATLFLACGAVMHGFAGQLDLRRLSGLWRVKGWGIVSLAMLVGCLNLSGFPFTPGFFSKDMILAQAFTTPGMAPIGWILLITAGLTAYYTFRVFFRVFVGPVHYEPGDDIHDAEAEHESAHADDESHGSHPPAHDDHGHDAHHAGDHFHPHPPGWAINLVLGVLAIASIACVATFFVEKESHGWVGSMLRDSTAAYAPAEGGEGAPEGTFFGHSPHEVMYYVSAVVGGIGILAAFFLHYLGRKSAETAPADRLLPVLGPIAVWAQHKWYVDEFYDWIIRRPLLLLAHVFFALDKLLVDGVVNAFGAVPRWLAGGLRPSQNGVLQGYAAGMAGGLGLFLLIVWVLSH